MNSLSIIIGSIIIVISLILAIVGGWEKFHLERENNAWLALFIVGMIGIIAGVVLVLIGIYTDRPKKIGLDDARLRAIYDYNKSLPQSVPITQQAVRLGGTIGLPLGVQTNPVRNVAFAPTVPAGVPAAAPTLSAPAAAPTLSTAVPKGASEVGITAASKFLKVDITNISDYIRESVIDNRTPEQISLIRESLCPIKYKPLQSVPYSDQKMGGLFD
jgi:hypothetical protein